MSTLRIAVIGDVHLHWGDADVEHFNRSDYDHLLFVGDLGAYRHRGALGVARSLAALTKPALCIPGNHDGPSLGQLAGEVLGRPVLERAFGGKQGLRVSELTDALGPVVVAGYSEHPLAEGLAVIAGRPHSMGGPTLNFRPWLLERHGIGSLEESAARLEEIVDGCAAERLIFLAHNGPSGLGDRRADIWGCDFRQEEGDQGDEDLRAAVEHAVAQGRQVLAVVAGHMHHRLRGGGQRTWLVRRDGVLYVNAARVPRVMCDQGLRHHVRLTIDGARCEAEEVLVPAP